VSNKDELRWLQGKRIAICEPDSARFTVLSDFLKHYGLEVVALNTKKILLADLESRRYSTHRTYIAVFIAAELAKIMEPLWMEITQMNPGILQTPLILMGSDAEKQAVQPLIDLGYFKYTSPEPMTATFVLRLLRSLNRWKAMSGDITPAATLVK
jgi:uncharacterized SAM-dependent methyltransferase